MKRLPILLSVFLLMQVVSSAQILFQRTITFESNGQYALIDHTQPGNIWQKGAPHKSFFDSAFSVPNAIMTDTAGLTPINNFSSFKVKMQYVAGCWGTGYLTFAHKYQTDSAHAGGFIDISYDTSGTYFNIIYDTIEPLMGGNIAQNFYSANDTITGGIPAFTGNSNGWQYSSVYWVWEIGCKDKSPYHDSLTIRFNFKSDGVAHPMEGWMIDDIFLEVDECTGAINDMKPQRKVTIYPNPVKDLATFVLINFTNGNYKFELMDEMGKSVIAPQQITPPMFRFSNPGLADGAYFYRVTDGNGERTTGKLMIMR